MPCLGHSVHDWELPEVDDEFLACLRCQQRIDFEDMGKFVLEKIIQGRYNNYGDGRAFEAAIRRAYEANTW